MEIGKTKFDLKLNEKVIHPEKRGKYSLYFLFSSRNIHEKINDSKAR